MNPLRQAVKRALTLALPRSRWIVSGPPSSGAIALTFDDGPHPDYTPRVLDSLARHGVQATFFVVGQMVVRHPDLVRRMVAEGHLVGGHSFTHSEPAETPARTLLAEVRATSDLLFELTATRPRYFRPPKGELSAAKMIGLLSLGQTIALWNRDTRDFEAPSDVGIQPWVSSYRPAEGDVILMHDTHRHCVDAVGPLVHAARASGIARVIRLDAWQLPALTDAAP